MKLTITNPSEKKTMLDIEPTISIVDLIIKLYKKNNQIDDIILYTDSTDKDGTKLEVGKNIEDYAINETSILKLHPTKQLEIPIELFCPLSMQIFLDPVELPCGTTVERQVIEKWLLEKGSSPFNRELLNQKDLKTNEVMKKKVDDFFEQYKNNPFIGAIRKKQQYQFPKKTPQLTAPVRRETSEPDTDDFFSAIDNAGYQAFSRVTFWTTIARDLNYLTSVSIRHDNRDSERRIWQRLELYADDILARDINNF